jgi:hypothetical protein
MEIGPASLIVLNLHGAGPRGASLAQMRMWLVPQKAEHEHDYNINRGYFEMLLDRTLADLVKNGYIEPSQPEGAEDGDVRTFSLTERGARYVEELAAASQLEAQFDYG